MHDLRSLDCPMDSCKLRLLSEVVWGRMCGSDGLESGLMGLGRVRPAGAGRSVGVMGGGSILTGLVLGAIGVFVIERKLAEAAAFAAAGAVLISSVAAVGVGVAVFLPRLL